MERSENTSVAHKNADLIASLVQFQGKAGRGLNKPNFETFLTPAPSVKSELPRSSASESQTADQLPAVSKRIALVEKQKKSDST
jgi:hypothetical protein